MRVVSTIKYYNNIQILRHTMCLPSYRNKAFPTQIFRKLLITKIMRKLRREEDLRDFLMTHFHAPFSIG